MRRRVGKNCCCALHNSDGGDTIRKHSAVSSSASSYMKASTLLSQTPVLLLLLILPILSLNAAAMTFTIGDRLQNGQELSQAAILAEGDIIAGDADRLFKFLVANRDRIDNERLSLVPNSNGGVVSEALKMAQILDSGMYSVWLPPNFSTRGDMRLTKCISACFSLVVGAVSRITTDGTLGLHRPFLSRAAYATLSVKDAQSLHEQSLSELRQWFQYKGVPGRLIDTMMSTPSTDIYWMSQDDIRALGKTQAWVEELMIARCNFESRLFESWSEASIKGEKKLAEILQRQLDRQTSCTKSVILERRSEFLSAKPAFLLSKRE
jgi:hypothetical protein